MEKDVYVSILAANKYKFQIRVEHAQLRYFKGRNASLPFTELCMCSKQNEVQCPKKTYQKKPDW